MATTATAVKFPSVQWFDALNEIVSRDVARARRNGQADAVVGFKVGPDVFKVTFDAFTVGAAERIDDAGLANVEFWLEEDPAVWKDMISYIREHGRAEGMHTLNSIDLAKEGGFARAGDTYHDGDPLDAFHRFAQTFQDYFDASAQLDTKFA